MLRSPVTEPVPSVTDPIARVEREITMLIRRTLESLWSSGYRAPPVDRFTYPVLALLDAHGPLGLGDLTRRLGLSKPTTSRHVTRLAEAGLVDSRPDPRDVRAVIITLTPPGAAEVGRLRAVRRARLAQVLDDWSDADRHGLATLLARLNVDLEQHRG